MKNILDNINMLDGFITNEHLSFSLVTADNNQLNPPTCGKYNGPPDEPIDSDKREESSR